MPGSRTAWPARMNLLVPLDRSPRDGMLVPFCRTLVEDPDGRIVILHVLSPAKACARGAIQRATAYLIGVAQPLIDDGIHVDHVVRVGDPAAEIIAISHEADVDLIVMATRGQGEGRAAAMRSVPAAVMRYSTRSIVVISESALLRHAEERMRLQSEYLAGVIWTRRDCGILTEEQAGLELDRLAAAGLDRAVLRSTYTELARTGARPPWIDFDVQISTLRQFLPDALPSSDAADAA